MSDLFAALGAASGVEGRKAHVLKRASVLLALAKGQPLSRELVKRYSDSKKGNVARELMKRFADCKKGSVALSRELAKLLEHCHGLDVAPPKELVEAFTLQLSVNKTRRKQSRARDARDRAITLLAKNPNLSTKKLALKCRASRPAVMAWRKDPAFKRAVFEEAAVEVHSADTVNE